MSLTSAGDTDRAQPIATIERSPMTREVLRDLEARVERLSHEARAVQARPVRAGATRPSLGVVVCAFVALAAIVQLATGSRLVAR